MILLNFSFRLISKDNFGKFGNKRFYRDKKFGIFDRNVKLYARQQYIGKLLEGDLSFTLYAYFTDKRNCD